MASNTDKIEIFIMSSTKLSQMTYRLMAVEWSVRIFHLKNKNTFEQVKLAGASRAFINWRIRISIRVTCLTLSKILQMQSKAHGFRALCFIADGKAGRGSWQHEHVMELTKTMMKQEQRKLNYNRGNIHQRSTPTGKLST